MVNNKFSLYLIAEGLCSQQLPQNTQPHSWDLWILSEVYRRKHIQTASQRYFPSRKLQALLCCPGGGGPAVNGGAVAAVLSTLYFHCGINQITNHQLNPALWFRLLFINECKGKTCNRAWWKSVRRDLPWLSLSQGSALLGLNTILNNSVPKSHFYKKLVVNSCTLLTAINTNY